MERVDEKLSRSLSSNRLKASRLILPNYSCCVSCSAALLVCLENGGEVKHGMPFSRNIPTVNHRSHNLDYVVLPNTCLEPPVEN